jgi:CheY-like chemotaxis protein
MEDRNKRSVLIVDDSNLNRQILIEFLKTKDFEIMEAADGKEAFDKIVSDKPDIILLDLIMPVMDGFETMEKMKSNGIKTPVIVITAYIKENTYYRCKELGAAGFLNKPVKMHELYGIISDILENEPSKHDKL